MKAMLLEEAVKLSLKDMPMPECEDGGAVVRVEACGICRTDMKCYYRGQRDLHLPRILGHEIAGIVLEIKSGDGPEPGSHVQVYPGLSCGSCRFCRQGFDNLCEHLEIMGFSSDGGFSAYLKIPPRGVAAGVLQPIPSGISFAEAAMTEPLACCINMLEALGVRAGENLVIFGAGRFGLLTAMLARLRGVKNLILFEPDQKRRLQAAEFGFRNCYDSRDSDIGKKLESLTAGSGIDAAVTCCPLPEVFSSAVNLLSKRGRVGFFSGLVGADLPGIDLNLIHYKELTVKGAYGCSIRHNRAALSMIGSGTVDVRPLITREIALDELRDGLLMVKNQSELSVVVTQF
jgi:L-iditol 2-dehydrogenase